MADNGSEPLQVKNLRYSRTGVLRYAFGLPSTIEAPDQANSQKRVAQEELKPFWMRFKKDEAKFGFPVWLLGLIGVSLDVGAWSLGLRGHEILNGNGPLGL